MLTINGRPLPFDSAFTDANGTQYPANWLRYATEEQKAAIGILEVPEPEPYDDRFYWGVDSPKELTGLQALWVRNVKEAANMILARTDWTVTRLSERQVPIPEDVALYRGKVLTECGRLTLAIEAAVDVPELISIVTNQNWPEE